MSLLVAARGGATSGGNLDGVFALTVNLGKANVWASFSGAAWIGRLLGCRHDNAGSRSPSYYTSGGRPLSPGDEGADEMADIRKDPAQLQAQQNQFESVKQ